MNANTIVCPKCKASIPLTDAVTHGIREQLEKEFAAKQQELQDTLALREKALTKQKNDLEQAQARMQEQVEQKLAEERKRLLEEARKQERQVLNIEMQDLKDKLAAQKASLETSQKAELALRNRQNEIEEKAARLDLEVARKVAEQREVISKQAASNAAEAERLKLAEKEKVITDLQTQISVLKQKAEQGSMQLQGEVLELDLEAQLKNTFTHDLIEEVSKGTRGGDIKQNVRTNMGHECGLILWETKRTRNWSGIWTDKLKQDMRAAKADLAVLVSQALPDGIKHFGQVDGVWVCDYATALPLAIALRAGMLNTAMARLTETGKAGKMEEMYAYVCGNEFRQHVMGLVESLTSMRDDLEKERNAMERIWAAREKQVRRAIQHTAQLYGNVQGIAGPAALPEIQSLELGTTPTTPRLSAPGI